MRYLFALFTLGIILAGCGKQDETHASLDPSSAIVDPSKVRPVTKEMELQAGLQEGKEMPEFKLPTTTGMTTNLQGLAGGKPAVLYFIQKRCPCCVEAEPFYTELSNAYKGKIAFIGIINGNRTEADSWAKTNTFDWPIFCDEFGKVIRQLGVTTGVYTMVINPEGTIVKVFPGYSADSLQQLTSLLGGLAKMEAPKLEFKSAPKKLATGCSFD